MNVFTNQIFRELTLYSPPGLYTLFQSRSTPPQKVRDEKNDNKMKISSEIDVAPQITDSNHDEDL